MWIADRRFFYKKSRYKNRVLKKMKKKKEAFFEFYIF